MPWWLYFVLNGCPTQQKLDAESLKKKKKFWSTKKQFFSAHLPVANPSWQHSYQGCLFDLLFFNWVVGTHGWILTKKLLIQHLWPSPTYFRSHWLHKWCTTCRWIRHLAKSLLSLSASSSLSQECGEKEGAVYLSLAPKVSKDIRGMHL